jgi:hypothetical protein
MHGERPQGAGPRFNEHARRCHHPPCDPGGIGDCAQLYPPRAVWPSLDLLGGRLGSQSSLAAPGRAGQGHQPRRREQLGDRGELVPAADERGELHREVVGLDVERQQPRHGWPDSHVNQLEDVLGPRQVVQPMNAKISKPPPLRHGVSRQGGRDITYQNLARLGDVAQANATIEGGPNVLTVGTDLPITGRQGHTGWRPAVGPLGDRNRNGLRGSRERLDAVVSCEKGHRAGGQQAFGHH